MTRDELIKSMAASVVDHLSVADVMTVARASLAAPERMMAYLNTMQGKAWTPPEFAAYALHCAKRIMAGGAS